MRQGRAANSDSPNRLWTLCLALLLVSTVRAEESRITFVLDGFTQGRYSASSDSAIDDRLTTEAGANTGVGLSWQSGSRQLVAGYQFNTLATYGNWQEVDDAEVSLSNRLTGSAVFSQQDRLGRWDLAASHRASGYNAEQDLTLNPFDFTIRQGLSLSGGVNARPSSRTTLRLSANAGTSISADFEPLGHTVGWTASISQQLKPRTSASMQVSQTYAYTPDVDDPSRIDSAQLGLSRRLENGSASASLGVSQASQGDFSNEAVTGSLSRRWQWPEHQTEIRLGRSISSTLLELTQLPDPADPTDTSPDDSQPTPGQNLIPEVQQSLGIQDTLQLSYSSERLCERCSVNLTVGGARSEAFSGADSQYGANASARLGYRITRQQTATASYRWQGQNLNASNRQEIHQGTLGWSRSLDRRVGVNASLQYSRSIADTTDQEVVLRAGASYRLGAQ